MGRARIGALLGIGAGCVLVVLGASNCAGATEIIVEVRAESALCNSSEGIETGIAVSTVDRINDEELEIFQTGCTDRQMVGKLTITPSGSKDAEVGIRIVTGVGIGAGDCHGPKWENCILARRTIRFSPRESNYLSVYLSAACIGRACGEKECDRGACVDPSTIPDDGGVAIPDDGGPPDSGTDDSGAVDGGDPCALCRGTGKTCDAKTRICKVDCAEANCRNRTPCPSQLDCVFTCSGPGDCQGTGCGGSNGSCEFQCTGANACNDVACSRESCLVRCDEATLACDRVKLDGGANDVRCTSKGADVSCDNVECSGTTCSRTCGPPNSACGSGGTCALASDCRTWELRDGG